MNAGAVTYDEIRKDVAGVVNNVATGGCVVYNEVNKPVAALISYEEFIAFREYRENVKEEKADLPTEADWRNAVLEVLDEHDAAWRQLADS